MKIKLKNTKNGKNIVVTIIITIIIIIIIYESFNTQIFHFFEK
jgi:hypothetical protein